MSMNQTALHFAATQGHGSIVEMLVTAGARADVRESQFDKTPAEWARETDESEIAARLEQGGAR